MTLNKLIRVITVAMLGLFSLGVAVAGGSHGVQKASVEGSAKADKLSACVRETPFMRSSHFELIKHQRDITVHQGIRDTKDSLAGCVDCHAGKDSQGKAVAVNAPGEFCAGCHAYTAVTLDCFSCHSAVPSAANATMGSRDPAVVEQAHAGVQTMGAGK